jgi:signal transduction histidine kinase
LDLSNAVKFTLDGSQIRLSAEKVTHYDLQLSGLILPSAPKGHPTADDFIKIAVSDTGIGIKSVDLVRILRPFEQGENTADRRYEGTGLGLSLTKELVGLHRGTIWAESEGEGNGSTFNFVIPF